MGVKNRSFVNLATLAPGVIAATADGSTNDIQNISVNGVRQNSNKYQIDGITAVDTGNNGASSNIPLDFDRRGQDTYFYLSGRIWQILRCSILSQLPEAEVMIFTVRHTDYRQHTGLNANSFSNNRSGLARAISDQKQKGFSIGGPSISRSLARVDRQFGAERKNSSS